MSYSVAARNLMLNALAAEDLHAALHDGYPGTSLANEISGGSPAYARIALAHATAANGIAAGSGLPATFNVPAGVTVRWVTIADALTAGAQQSVGPNGAAPAEFIVDVANNRIEHPAHGYSDDDTIVFYGGAAPGGLTEGTTYFVLNSTTDDYQVAATSGGAAIGLSSQAADDTLVSPIVEEAFAAQGTFDLNNTDLRLNF